MATARPVVSVFKTDGEKLEKADTCPMPQVMCCPLRPDLIRAVHTNVSKNSRIANAVAAKAGYDTAAESWGTGRAVARIPRAPGGGTHRAGQGAFGNMCRGGGMFSPLKIWKRWHRRVNVNEKRHAIASALAASSLPPLVLARGHRIDEVPEIPLIVSDEAESFTKTKQAMALMKKLGCESELTKVKDSKKIRAGKGKMRNRRYTMRRGPLIVYKEDNGIVRAMRNIPGVDTCKVDNLNLLTVAPGGVFGRFIIWTQGAFKQLKNIYGTYKSGAPTKSGYTMPRASMENADLDRLINSTEIQSVLRPRKVGGKALPARRNPLVNPKRMRELNPYADEAKAARKNAPSTKAATKKAHKEYNKKHANGDNSFYKKLMKAYEPKPKPAEEDANDEE